jgi:transposase
MLGVAYDACVPKEAAMPKLLHARPPKNPAEQRTVRKLAASRHAPGDWIQRARMIARSWDGARTTQIAAELGCHPQTVRQRLARFAAEGVDGLGDRPGGGRPPRLTEHERSQIIALARSTPPGRLHRKADGTLAAAQEREPAHWTLDALTAAAHRLGIQVQRSQVRRILLRERVRWRPPRSWASSTDPDFAPNQPGSSRSTPTRPRARRSSAPTNSAR